MNHDNSQDSSNTSAKDTEGYWESNPDTAQAGGQSLSKFPSGWSVYSRGDNGVDLIQYFILTETMTESAEKATTLATFMTGIDKKRPLFDTAIHLRSWEVQIVMSVPTDGWWTIEQKSLAEKIAAAFPRSSNERTHPLDG